METLVIFFLVLSLVNLGTVLTYMSMDAYQRRRDVAVTSDLISATIYIVFAVWSGSLLF